MGIVKLTEKDSTSSIENDASFLITQKVIIDGVEREAVLRATGEALIVYLNSNFVDSELSENSELPVQNKAVKAAIDALREEILAML